MKLVSWNVNGLRAVLGKGFKETIYALDADAVCIQETKMQPEQMTHTLDDGGYSLYWNSVVLTKREMKMPSTMVYMDRNIIMMMVGRVKRIKEKSVNSLEIPLSNK